MPTNKTIYLSFAIVFLVLMVGFIVYVIISKLRKEIKLMKKQIEVWGKTTYHISAAGDKAFQQLPLGIIVYDETYTIKWVNDFARNSFNVQLNEASLNIISTDLVTLCNSTDTEILITFGDKKFEFTNDKENKVLYFFDVTQREDLKQQYHNKIVAMGLITIDNLEESLKRYDIEDKTTISGKILGEISQWAEEYGAFLQSIDEDRIFLVCDLYHLELMIEDKFSILNKVRDIAKEAHIRTTISIGMAAYDTTEIEVGKIALNAVELAEKRGGDQAVVNIQGKKIRYIGGQTNALEKNTLVAARMQTNALKDAAENASNILITAHNMADCDAIGSAIGIYRLLESFNLKKSINLVLEAEKLDVTAAKIYTLIMEEEPYLEEVIVDEEKANSLITPNTLLVICDTQSPLISMFPDLVGKAKHLAVIDHHRVGEVDFQNVDMSYVETYSSSTVELITEMFIFTTETKITPLEATIMLAGMVVDTNNFTFRTGTRTFEAAAQLKELGADMVKVKDLLRDSLEYERIVAEALINVEVCYNHFAIYKLTSQVIRDRTLLAKISERLLQVEGIQASFTIAKLENEEIAVSGRSLEGVNVQLIMEEMGGGGHLQSAAVQIPNTTIDEVKEKLLNIIRRDYDVLEGDEKMKVILKSDVKGKGKKDDIIEVNNGYGNYLINNNLAVIASDQNLKELEESKEQAKLDALNRRNVLEKLKSEIEDKSVTIYLKQGNDGKVFGHITTKQICEEFEAQNGIRLDKRKLELPAEINSIGIYQASIILDKDLIANFQVNVLGK